MLGLGWRGDVVGGGLEGAHNPHEGEATSSSRNNCLVAGGAVSVISAQRPRLMCRSYCWAATRSPPTLALSSQLLSDEDCPMKKGDNSAFDPKIFPTAVTPNVTGVYALLVVSPTRGNSRILEAGRRRSGPASCGSLARTELVGGCVPDRKNEVV